MKYTWLVPHFLSFLVILAVVLFVAHPAYHGGLFQSHDDVQVTRIQAMVDELRGGQFPVRYISEFGNGGGYFLFNFYSPLVYYMGAGLVFVGLSSIAAVKAVYLMMIGLGTVGIFVLLRSKTSLSVSTVGTVLFLLSPYVFHDLFHRGALPESSAFLLSPWVLWAFLKLKEKASYVSFVLAVVSFSVLILTHILTAAMMGALLVVWLWPFPARKTLAVYLVALSAAILLSGFYFFPAVLESGYTIYQQTDLVIKGYREHYIDVVNQVGSMEQLNTKTAFLGFGLMGSLFLVVLSLLDRTAPRFLKAELSKVVFIAGMSLFLMSSSSLFLWEHISLLRYLQFSYRLLTVTTLLIVYGLALVLEQVKSRSILFSAVFLLIVAPHFIYRHYYQALGYQYVAEYRVEGLCRTTAWNDEHLPKWVQTCLPRDGSVPLLSSSTPELQLTELQESRNGREMSFVPQGKPGGVVVAKYYFPGWKVLTADGQQLPPTAAGPHGLISFEVPESALGTQVTVTLGSTPVRSFGNVISMATFFGLLVLSLIFLWSISPSFLGHKKKLEKIFSK